MANTYAFAICGALLLAVTLTPVLCSFLFHNKQEETETFVDRIMKLRYLVMLDRVLNHRYLLLTAMGGLLAFTITPRFPSWEASSCLRSKRATSGFVPSCRGP